MSSDDPIYLDYNATTPVAPAVIAAMLPALRDAWGNPSSPHAYGRRALAAVDLARERVARLLSADPAEIVFTSGGTESDNAAILGVADARRDAGRHLIVSSIEHEAVEQPARYLEERGWTVTRVPVDGNGRVDPGAVAAALCPDTVLVSVMHAHNETGVLQPVAEIGRLCRERGVLFHTDAAQSVGKLPTAVDALGVDLLTIAGHKFHAPKGVGALYVRRGTAWSSLLRGGSHEGGRRAGTEATPILVGLGVAAELAIRDLDAHGRRLAELRDRLERGLREHVPDLVVHGARVPRLPNTLFVALPGAPADRLLARLDGVAAGAGSACHAGEPSAPAVLLAMGVEPALARATVRLTVGRPTTEDEVDRAAERVGVVARSLRAGS